METVLILLMGYAFGRSEHYHAKARGYWDVFKTGLKDGLKDKGE